jgi:hypothetical protein
MVSHLVLFRPKPDLPPDARERLVAAFAAALRDIPDLLHARVGKRVTHGRPYEQMMGVDFQYAAVLEFADVDRLKAYLEHPVHEALGAAFFECLEDVLIYDYEMREGTDALTLAGET